MVTAIKVLQFLGWLGKKAIGSFSRKDLFHSLRDREGLGRGQKRSGGVLRYSLQSDANWRRCE